MTPVMWPLAIAGWITLVGGFYYIDRCEPASAAAWFAGNVFVNTAAFTAGAVVEAVRALRRKGGGA